MYWVALWAPTQKSHLGKRIALASITVTVFGRFQTSDRVGGSTAVVADGAEWVRPFWHLDSCS
jgi:hypothetical protein